MENGREQELKFLKARTCSEIFKKYKNTKTLRMSEGRNLNF